jgi:hypothetical protein
VFKAIRTTVNTHKQGMTDMKTTFDWTWTVEDDEANTIVELDVRVHGEYNLPFNPQSDCITITGVKSLFRKHGRLREFPIPEDLEKLCLAALQKDDELQNRWIEELSANAAQEHAETVAEYRREHKED